METNNKQTKPQVKQLSAEEKEKIKKLSDVKTKAAENGKIIRK